MCSPSASPIDFSSLPPEAIRAAEFAVRDVLDRERRAIRWRDLCDNGSDAEIIEAATKECDPRTPITLANRYKSVARYQDIFARHNLHGHPRRPVIMAGAKEVVIFRYAKSDWGGINGYAEQLLQRLIRYDKVSAFSARELRETIRPRVQMVRRRYPNVNHYFHEPSIFDGDLQNGEAAEVYVNGKTVCLNKSERDNIRALRDIIRKTDALDQRREAVRSHMRARLAA